MISPIPKRIAATLAASLCLAVAVAAKPVNTDPYPLGNPVIKHMYTADAAPHVMPDGRVWMVTSVDLEAGGGYSTMHSYSNFSSANMLDWHDHRTSLRIEGVAPNEGPSGVDWIGYANAAIHAEVAPVLQRLLQSRAWLA